MPSLVDLRKHIDEFLAHRRDPNRYTEISFYGGTFLGLAKEQIQLLLATAAGYVRKGVVDGIRFSTRPDTIDAERLELIAPYPVTTVELGVQSMRDDVLAHSARGHTAEETRRAVTLLADRPYQIGLQMMIGLPGDTAAGALSTGRQLAGLNPDFVRIYPTVVFKGSPLARWYQQGRYEPLSLEAAVALCAELYLIFARHEIPVIRMGLQAGPELEADRDLMAGPFHPAFGELVRSAVWQDAISRHLEKEGTRRRRSANRSAFPPAVPSQGPARRQHHRPAEPARAARHGSAGQGHGARGYGPGERRRLSALVNRHPKISRKQSTQNQSARWISKVSRKSTGRSGASSLVWVCSPIGRPRHSTKTPDGRSGPKKLHRAGKRPHAPAGHNAPRDGAAGGGDDTRDPDAVHSGPALYGSGDDGRHWVDVCRCWEDLPAGRGHRDGGARHDSRRGRL